MPSPRAIISAIRTLAYGGIAGFLAVGGAEAREMLDAVLLGGVLADYSTWLIRSILLFPAQVLHGCYDCCVNALFGWFMWRFVLPETNLTGQAMGMAFLAFLLVLGIKVAYYGVKFLEEED